MLKLLSKIAHDTTTPTHKQLSKYPVLAKKWYLGLTAYCVL